MYALYRTRLGTVGRTDCGANVRAVVCSKEAVQRPAVMYETDGRGGVRCHSWLYGVIYCASFRADFRV